MEGSMKKNFKITKIDKGILSKKEEENLMKKVFSSKDSYSAAKKASNAFFKKTKKKKTVKFILENQKANKNGVKKQLAYTAYRVDEKKTVKIAGKELVFTSTPIVKSCLITHIK